MTGSTDAETWQVLNKSQAVQLAQLTGKYQAAVMALCAEVAGTEPGQKDPHSLGTLAACEAFTKTNIACPLVTPAIVLSCLYRIAYVLP